MSNEIKIGNLLTQASVENLEKYFYNIAEEVSIEDLLGESLDSILGVSKQPDSKPDSKVVSEVFTLICYVWKNYKEKGCNTRKRFSYINRQSKSYLCYDKKQKRA